MSEKNKPDQPEVHVYDGIEEHDNQLPRWWLAILYGTIVFAASYYGYYELGPGKSLQRVYEEEKQLREFAALAAASTKKTLSDSELLAIVGKPGRAEEGHKVFTGKCVACHGAEGGGGIGPNLTDAYWIHGGKPSNLVKTITEGVGDKGMPPWGPVISTDEIHSLVAYIRSIGGTNPAGAKAPQGEKTAE